MGKFQFKMADRLEAPPERPRSSGWLQWLLLIGGSAAVIYVAVPLLQR